MMTVIHPLNVLVVVTFILCKQTCLLGLESLSKVGNMTRCIQRERKALLVFKQGVVSDARRQGLLYSWRNETEDCCKWNGVGCDDRTGHVTHLYLSSQISPFSINSTSVIIGDSLLDLPDLNYLDLSSNLLAGIPEFIGSLTKLAHLDLSDTHIGGSIPDQIGNLLNLQYLNLRVGNFGGPIPKFLGSLSRLSYLDLSNNFFSGVIPHELEKLLKLQHLNLSFNSFDSPIPKFIGSLHNLRYLDLSNIRFSGVIPHELENLSKLRHLDLNSNSLAGPIPEFIGSFNSLRYLDLANNFDLTGGENFEWLFNLSSLTHLDLSGINIAPPSIWVSFIQRIPSISFMRLERCNLLAPSFTSSNFSSSISKLYLQQNFINSSIFTWLPHLSGSLEVLDLGINMLEGRIPQSFCHLTALTYLDLSANQLNGELPKFNCNLTNLKIVHFSVNNFTGNLADFLFGPFPLLQELLISKNQLTGSLPDITNLSFLKHLQVDSNQLNGYLPTVFEHHSDLEFLDLSDNHLRGSLPNFTGFSSLRVLNLQSNEFSGSLPDFTGCSSLQVLGLGKNQLTDWESQSTGLLSSLKELDLSMNSIRSTISEAHLSNLSSLLAIRTSYNSLTFDISSEWLPPFKLQELSLASCKLGPNFPNWIRNQLNITSIDISNSQISDTIPIWFWNFSDIIELNLSSNNISGKVSWKYHFIQEIDLSSNNFDGPLPPIPADCSRLNLSHNKFSGTLISLSVDKYVLLSLLDISHNQLFGAIPDNWMHFQNLVFLNLGYNNFSGRIPMSIGNLHNLQALILRNNKLYGEVPASLRNCSSLGFVDFGLNKLSGKALSWIGEELPQLYALVLKSNRFYGSLPYEICHLSNLYFLDLSINRISGTIPPCFGNLTAMIRKGTEVAEHSYPGLYTTDYSYIDAVLAGWKGQEFEYGRNFAYLKMIDLSTNKLTGEIPIGITRLLDFKGLNLSGNGFYGEVPPEIGQLKVLESLDLSKNKFTGEIPVSMSGLNFLAYLDISNNNFSGRIPSGPQLQTFDISTYEGNTELCGKPLTYICPGNVPDDHMHPSTDEYEIEGDNSAYERWLHISAVLGFSTSFWGIIGSLVLNRRSRHAYFFFLYNLKERFYVAMAVRIARFQRTV